jgi:SAM-dependent methyltransferase
MTASWGGTPAGWLRRSRTSPASAPGNACWMSGAAPGHSPVSSSPASGPMPSPPSIRHHRSSRQLGSAAEALPFDDHVFDVALAQLVVHFMADPVAGLREMARVTRRDGVIAACVWDHGGEQGPLSLFWQAVRALDPAAQDESDLAGAREGHLAELFATAALREIDETVLEVRVEHASFEEWWEPFTFGVGPAGAYVKRLTALERERLRERCRSLLPSPPFALPARAWAVRGRR